MPCRKLKVGTKNILKELPIAFERPISVNAILKESDKRLKRLLSRLSRLKTSFNISVDQRNFEWLLKHRQDK